MYPHCRVCNGPLVFLGTLGVRDHFRCRDCGLDCSRPAEETDLELVALTEDDEDAE